MHRYSAITFLLYFPLLLGAQTEGGADINTAIGLRFFSHSGLPEAGKMQSINLHLCRYKKDKAYIRPSITLGHGRHIAYSYFEPSIAISQTVYYGTAGYTLGLNGKYIGFTWSNEIGLSYDAAVNGFSPLSNHLLAINSGQAFDKFHISMGLPFSLSFNQYVPGIMLLNVGAYYRF